jgi:hypothetical protein
MFWKKRYFSKKIVELQAKKKILKDLLETNRI